MPVVVDIRDNKVLGREYKRGFEEGRLLGGARLLRRLIAARFGTVPGLLNEKIVTLPADALEQMAVRLLRTDNVEDLLR